MSKENNENKQESVPEKEERILHFWNENKVFEKTLTQNAPLGEFSFYDGPPFATGEPHYGHLLQSVIKDAIPRYKTMRGYHVPRRWGWDCHGLPIENLIQKELNLKTKKDIEAIGIDKFNRSARESIFRYADDWKKTIPRIGRFVDMEDDYRTMDSTFTESVWWVFKTLYDKGLIFMGHKSMHICPRCETTLANFEVGQGYKDVTDISITVKFELVDEPGTFVLAWTTTPWTLPGNVALAVGEKIDYVKIEGPATGGQKLVLAKERLSAIGGEYRILEEFKGKDLIGRSYKPLYNYYSGKKDLDNVKNGWKIYGANFVTTEDGVGVVHIAPAFGEDDMKLGREKKLPFVQHVGMDGRFNSEVKDFAGISVKPKDDPQSTDVLIIKDLAHRGLLFAKEKITHSYPHCWRCDTPLLNYAASSWFVDVPAIRDKIIANNKKINWIPESVKEGRFGKGLETAPDWSISRSRYWGAPIPVWKCDKCEEAKVAGSIAELGENMGGASNNYFILRHGEADSNVGGVLSSAKFQKDNHLTKKGEKQVLSIAKKLKKEKIDLIISSDYTRTAETAKIVAGELGIPEKEVFYDKRLRELQVGDLDGIKTNEYHNYFSSPEERFTKNAPGGENHSETRRRMLEAVFDLEKKYKGKNVLIVSHGDPIWVLFAGAAGLSSEDAVKSESDLYLDNAEYKKLDFVPFPHNENYELDLHRPYIDEITFPCACGGKMKRIPEVFDCWFESGAMPYGQMHYPFENKKEFDNNFPAHFIGEAIDQTRGWFYSLLVLSTALFNKPAFKNVIATGLILAEDGQKMSKRLKNYPEVSYLINKYGADAARYYLLTSPVVKGEEMRFSEKGVDEIYKKIILRTYNVISFLEMYGQSEKRKAKSEKQNYKNVLDKWILARLDELAGEVTDAMEKYELDKATRPFGDFVDDLSTWYLRRSRDRFKSEDEDDKNSAFLTLRYAIKRFAILSAPFTPFMADDIYGKVKSEKDPESVHLEKWPERTVSNEKEILDLMKKTREIVSLGLEARAKAGIKVRQPLNELSITNYELRDKEDYLNLVKDELNIKNVKFVKEQAEPVVLDMNITEDLKEEGMVREFVRNIQELRKKAGLQPTQKAILKIETDEKGKKFLDKFDLEIKKSAGLEGIVFEKTEGDKVELDGTVFVLTLSV